jgi:hypothetical protein
VGWEPTPEHETSPGQEDDLGPTHTDIQYRDPTTGKVDETAGKGKLSGKSEKSNYVDPLSDPKNH